MFTFVLKFRIIMRIFIRILIGVVLAFPFISCNTDVDNYADYKDITIVYGLLETNTDTTFIKITKAYLGPGNALVMALNPDSSNYAGKLDARLIGVKNSTDLPEIILDTITKKNKLAGDSIFYFPQQKLYYTTATIDPAATYTLKVNRNVHVVEASTKLVQDFTILQPTNRFNFAATAATSVKWRAALNGKRHEVIIVFNYEELWPGSADTLKKTMVWNMGTKSSQGLDGTEELEIFYNGEDFYTRLASVIDVNALNVRRFAGNVDVFISGGGGDLSTYIEVNAPSNSIVQEVPQFSNVANGFGIFSSRKTMKRSYKMTVQSEIKLVENYPWGFEIKLIP
jgi:hypothetical protein